MRPAGGANVVIQGVLGVFTTTADARGFFVVLGVPAGDYVGFASKVGYWPGCTPSVSVEPGVVTDVSVWVSTEPILSACSNLGQGVPKLVQPGESADLYNLH